MVEPFETYVRRVFWGSVALVLIPAGILLFAGLGTYARGVALGGAASLINLILMAHGIRWRTDTSRRHWTAASFGSYSIRMGVIAAALVYAAVNGDISLVATIPALFCVQAVLLFGGLTGWLEGPD